MAPTIAQFFKEIKNAKAVTILAGQYEIRINEKEITHNFGDGFWHTMPPDNQIESMSDNPNCIAPDEVRILDTMGKMILAIQNPMIIVIFK